MKVTLYNRDGTANSDKFECENIWTHCGPFNMVVIKSDTQLPDLARCPTEYVITNLPYVSEEVDNSKMRQPDENEKPMTVFLLDDNGGFINTWKGAKGIYYQGNVIGFKVGEEWFTVCGNICIEPELDKK